MSKELSLSQSAQYVGPYRLEKTLGKGQTGEHDALSFLERRANFKDYWVTECASFYVPRLSLLIVFPLSGCFFQDWSSWGSIVLQVKRSPSK